MSISSTITDVKHIYDDEGRLIELRGCDINGKIIDSETFWDEE